MTKKQVKSKINRLFREYSKKLETEIDQVLHDADMWYGDNQGAPMAEAKRWILNKRNPDDRNADQIVVDGMLGDCDVSDYLHTRKELMLNDKNMKRE